MFIIKSMMTSKKLQLIDSDRVLVGTRVLKAVKYNPPFKDGSTIVVETTSDPANEYQQKLLPHELRGLVGGDLPKGFQLNIYRPEARTKGLYIVFFENISHGPRINLSVDYDFTDWAYRTNLVHFAEHLRSLIEQKLPNCQSAFVEKNEYGISMWCSVFLEKTEDCFAAYLRTDTEFSLLHKEALKSADRLFVEKLESHQSSEAGIKWWVRYVAVPIVSGGVGAALVSWLILHA